MTKISEKIKGAVEILERAADKGKLIDVGKGVCNSFDLNQQQFSFAKQLCEMDGYKLTTVFVNKVGEEGVKTAIQVMHSADKDQKYVVEHKSEISLIQNTETSISRLIARAKAQRRNNVLKVILKLADEGMSNGEIAKKLDIAESTVRNFRRHADKIEADAEKY